MRKIFVTIIITALCVCACGTTASVSNENSRTGSDSAENVQTASDISDADHVAAESNEMSEDNQKSALAEKYADVNNCLENGDYDRAEEIIGEMKPEASYDKLYACLENEDYDKALRIVEAMKPEQQTETITLTLDNWSTYYELKEDIRHGTWNLDAHGNILRSSYAVDIVLKSEYSDKLVSISGDVGYEYSYAPHKITNIDKATGQFETELIEKGPADDSVATINGQGTVSETREFDYNGSVTDIVYSYTCREGETYISGNGVAIYDADEVGTQYIYYPEEINIVSINGELVLRK